MKPDGFSWLINRRPAFLSYLMQRLYQKMISYILIKLSIKALPTLLSVKSVSLTVFHEDGVSFPDEMFFRQNNLATCGVKSGLPEELRRNAEIFSGERGL